MTITLAAFGILEEREIVLKAVTELFCIQKDSEAWRWLETLRQREQV